MLELADSWVWDSWLVDNGTEYHLFFLFASRALGDPERRHRRASVGHAVSLDLREWRRLPDALVRSDAPAIDDVATWTGSCVRDGGSGSGTWRMFFTGLSDAPARSTQVVTSARSDDLSTWHRESASAAARADPRWYATAEVDGTEDFRDPWLARDADGLWHMLVAASAPGTGPDRGVIGHATSPDLASWTVTEPLTAPGSGFDELEVPSIVEVDGEVLLMFSCLAGRMSERRRAQSPTGGVWVAPAGGVGGPFDLERAVPITDQGLYAGHGVIDRAGIPVLLAFENIVDGRFVGRLADPVPLGPLVVAARTAAAES